MGRTKSQAQFKSNRLSALATKGQTSFQQGSGRQGMKRVRKLNLDNKPALNRPSVRRLARRAGVKRISAGIYDEAPSALRTWLKQIVSDAVTFTEHAKRFTVTLNDIVMALKRNGITIYGFDITEKRKRLTRPLPKEALARAAQRVAAKKQQQQQQQTTPSLLPVVEQAVVAQVQQEKPTSSSSPTDRASESQPTPLQRVEAATAPTSTPIAIDLSPERALEIQTSLGAFRDTVVARQSSSDAQLPRILKWVGEHLRGKGHSACSAAELEVLLDVLTEKDAVMVTDDDASNEKVVWFM